MEGNYLFYHPENEMASLVRRDRFPSRNNTSLIAAPRCLLWPNCSYQNRDIDMRFKFMRLKPLHPTSETDNLRGGLQKLAKLFKYNLITPLKILVKKQPTSI